MTKLPAWCLYTWGMGNELITAADVFNMAGIKVEAGLFKDSHFWVTCPKCALEQSFWHATKAASEDITRITEYSCRDCGTYVGGVSHWGLQEQPLKNAVYRLKDYAIDTPVDLYLLPPGKSAKVLIPATSPGSSPDLPRA
jgi:hypothetical protein